MTRRSPISVADFIVAVTELNARGSAIDSMRKLLQLDVPAPLPSSRATGAHRTTTDTHRVMPDIPRAPHTEPPQAESSPTKSPSNTGPTTASLSRSTLPAIVPVRVTSAAPLDLSGDTERTPLFEPLFAPRQARGIVAAAVATRREGSEIDAERLLRDISRRHPVRRVPKQPIASLALGCQILADYSPAMEPYADDRHVLIGTLETTVGEPRVTIHTFRGSPLGNDLTSGRKWRPPSGGTPIVIVSDLGIGGSPTERQRSRRADWIQVARKARRRRCPVIAFVPFGSKRWDPMLTRLIAHVHWDRPMSVGIVRRAIGRGHLST